MLEQISYFPIFGKPLIIYIGIFALLFFLAAAAIPSWNRKMKKKIPIGRHFLFAKIGIALGIIHALLVFLASI
ncbi:MAG: hypothetical protein NTV63_05790 [Candidatus Woesearchaeota archaeon]|nr:hypothetical protein [Candidatus Woesearchaeota archaeon]